MSAVATPAPAPNPRRSWASRPRGGMSAAPLALPLLNCRAGPGRSAGQSAPARVLYSTARQEGRSRHLQGAQETATLDSIRMLQLLQLLLLQVGDEETPLQGTGHGDTQPHALHVQYWPTSQQVHSHILGPTEVYLATAARLKKCVGYPTFSQGLEKVYYYY